MSKYVGNILTDGAATGYSCKFNGSSTSLSVADNVALEFGSGDFTMEAWIYTANAATRQTIIAKTNSGGNDASSAFVWQIGKSGAETTGLLNFYHSAATTYITASTALSSNTWYHIAIVRSGNTFTQYINGTANGTASISTAIRDIPEGVYMGAGLYGVYFNGAISNLRIVKGTAVYTAAFTPPTQLFAITNTSLLTCQQPTIIDTSSNAFAITNTGGVTVSNFSPFPAYQAYNPASGGGTPGIWSLNDAAYAAQNQSWNMYDPYWKNTTLLLNGESAANGAQNNTFLDSSTNNFTITRNGNTTQGTFTPYGSLWSNYFDGSGDYLSVPANAAFSFGTGNFTAEAWVFLDVVNNNGSLILNQSYSGANGDWIIRVGAAGSATGKWEFTTFYGGTAYQALSNSSAVSGVWTHIAGVRNGNVFTLYVNGVAQTTTATNTNSVGFSNQTTLICGDNTSGVLLKGSVSNLRVVKGTAVYTSNFTPSTTPLTAVSGTSLLTCQSNRFIDNSSNNFAITVNGNTSVQRFSPFNPTAPYSASTIGGSGYFDGTGDYLTAPDNAALNFEAGDFCVECWFYPTTISGTQGIITKYAGGTGNRAFDIEMTSGVISCYVFSNGSDTYISVAGGTAIANAWNNIIFCRSGTTLSAFLNGTRTGTTTNSYIITSVVPVGIGTSVSTSISSPFFGYITDVRLVKGSAVYNPSSSTITVPTAPLTAITNTSLLTNFTNAGIPDAAMMNDLETVGNAQVSTSVKKYGTGSLAFDGTGDYLIMPQSTNLDLPGDFTIEFWVYLNATADQSFVGKWSRPGGVDQYAWIVQLISGNLRFYSGSSGSIGAGSTFTWSPATATWYHIAVTRSGSNLKAFINGVQAGSTATETRNLTATSSTSVGINLDGTIQPTNGYIDDLRITKGYARYTANFTPPTSSLQNL